MILSRRRRPPSPPKAHAGAVAPAASAKKRPKSTPPPGQPMLLGDVSVYAATPRSSAVVGKPAAAGCLALVVTIIYLPKAVAYSMPLYVRSRHCARAWRQVRVSEQ